MVKRAATSEAQSDFYLFDIMNMKFKCYSSLSKMFNHFALPKRKEMMKTNLVNKHFPMYRILSCENTKNLF